MDSAYSRIPQRIMTKRQKHNELRAFDVEAADAGHVADEIGALRAALGALEKSPVKAAAQAPEAIRRLLEIIENINLRLADLEDDG